MSAPMQAPFNDHITTFRHWRDGKMHRHKPLTYCSKYEAQQYCKNGMFFTPDMHGTLENGPVHVVLGLGCREPNPRKQVARTRPLLNDEFFAFLDQKIGGRRSLSTSCLCRLRLSASVAFWLPPASASSPSAAGLVPPLGCRVGRLAAQPPVTGPGKA